MRTINISTLKIIVSLLVAILIDCQLFAQVPSGNKLWFRADKGVLNGGAASLNGQKVTNWHDLSLDASLQNAGVCTRHFSDPGEVLPDYPTYSYSLTNSLNYNPIISFDGSGDGNALEFDTPVQGDQTVFVVFRALGKRGLHYSQPLLYGGDVSNPSEPGIDRVDLAFTVNDKSVSFGGGHSRDFTKNGNMNLNGRPGIGVFSRKVWTADHITPNLYVNGATDLLNDDNSFNGVGLINPDKMRMGKHPSNTDGNLNGLIAEVMVYDYILSDSERRKVESYLAIKYGITLNSGNDILGCDNGNNNFNYINSAGNIIWIPETSYKYDVAGLGKDSGFDLNQRISKSSNEGTILSMSMDNDFSEGNLKNRSAIAEGDFLFWSNNTGSHNPVVEQTNERPTDQTPNLILKRLDREWKVQETNTDGTNPGVVSIMVNLNGIACSARSTNDLILLIDKDGDGDFSTGTLDRYNASSFVSNQVIFENIDLLDGQIFTVATLINLNDPVITATDKTIAEGTTVVETVTATDADAGDTKAFSITGGADAALFEIDPATGELRFKVAPDFENPADNGGNNIYDLTVTVTDAANHTDSESIAVTVSGVNDNDPVITATDKTIAEGTTVVETVTATDADLGDTKAFSITGGADAALFNIDPNTGELRFKVAPDFENPADNGRDNIYDLTVTVTDAANHMDSETIAVTVSGVNDNDPVITATNETVAEGTTVVETVTATDADAGDTKAFSITGGADAALFNIDPNTGELRFKVAPDFENPADNGGNNIYDVTVTVTDGANHTDSESIAVTVTGVNDNDPVITATDKTIAEGTTVVETVTATDADSGDTKAFSITGGADAALFEIDPNTGELRFKVAPDFENPADNGGNNIYDVTVTVTDAANHTDSETIAVTVSGVNDNNPVITATNETVAEGTTVVETVTATDADAGDTKAFSITGGADAALFNIDPNTGELTFKVAPDFEHPADNGGNNIYDVTVTVTDAANHTDSETIAITVSGVNDNNPVITATDKTIPEGTTVVETVTATDADSGDTKAFSITGGADAALFNIDPNTGELTFKVAPDFENPADNGRDNIYNLTVTVTDGANHTDSESITVSVTGRNDNDPVITATDKTIAEGTTVVETVTATDADLGDTKAFSITGGADAALFNIDPNTGELRFKVAPDFENPADNGGNNIYDLTVTVTDGANHTDSESIAVTVSGVNDNDPVITATDKTIAEGTTVVETVTATDADSGDTKAFSITGGADAALFEIDPATGELRFKVAPDFENPADNGGNNIYDLTVTVTDGANHTDSESIAVTVSGVNDNDPVITATDKTIPEGTTVVETVTATDADAGDSKTFSITGGDDAALFNIDPNTGELTFKVAPDFENPADNGGNNIYNVTVTVTDGANHTDSESIAVTVSGVNDNDPVITATNETVAEGTTVVETVTATDADAGDTKAFSITGGADAALFEIDPATGELRFKVAPDFENPADNGGNNIYDLTVTVTDGANHTDSESIAVTVSGVNDNDPVITATDKTIPEGTTVVETVTATDADAGDSKTFSITGGDDAALFNIDPNTGELTFKVAPDFENPADNGGNNIYNVTVTVTDAANHTDSETIAVTVSGVNDNNPVITATDETIAEGTTVVETVTATDADAGDSKTFSITGGDDAALFNIDPNTGELTFKVAPDFEHPADNGGNNIYDLTVTVTDAANHTDSETIAITVSGMNDNDPVITATDKTIAEGTTVLETVTATDADAGDTKTFSITGGADAALFEIDPNTGELTFKVAPDFENPADNGGNNIYDLTVTVTDGANHTDSESITVSVTGTNDNDPVITATDKTIAEGTTVVETVTATDADAGDTKAFSITGGADAALFNIDPNTGELRFKVAPDFENPADNGGNNIYDVTVTVTDGANHTDSETIAVTVTGTNDNDPVITATDKTIAEGTTVVETVTATDADAGDSKTFSITGGADAALFNIDPNTGELTFKVAPDFENPADNGGNNIYDLTVTVTDAANHTDSESIAVSVTGVNDNAPDAHDDNASIDEGETLNGSNLLNNDTDLDGDNLNIVTTPIKNVTHGTLTIHPDGTYTYVPDPFFNGIDSFIYEVCDNGSPKHCSQATVEINVLGVNNKPYGQDKEISLPYESKEADLEISEPVDPDGDDMHIEILVLPKYGQIYTQDGTLLKIGDQISIEDLLKLKFDANSKFIGNCLFKYRIYDSKDLFSEAQVLINITNDLFIPNVFTPNSDPFNDTFTIPGIEKYPNNKIIIYNRWGNKVYTMQSYDNSWRGYGNVSRLISKDRLPIGTYYYILYLGEDKTPITGYIYMTY